MPLLAAACLEQEGAPSPDAGPDATAAEPGDAPWRTSPIGMWRITWDFDGWDIQGHNPIPTDRLTITPPRALYEGCLECGAEHVGAVDGVCFAVPAGVDGQRPREAYQLCVDGPELVGMIRWEAIFDGEREQVWTVRGVADDPR
jgi:hypothetical protein